ncbi:MAG: hypothetical protein JKX97_00835 [Candidatus Lindowbacteria bacterium]|nr:hypothetical protein [Candidatus Lindowbacteria bacterium]
MFKTNKETRSWVPKNTEEFGLRFSFGIILIVLFSISCGRPNYGGEGLPGNRIKPEIAEMSTTLIVVAEPATAAMESLTDSGMPQGYPEGDGAFQRFNVKKVIKGDTHLKNILVFYAFSELDGETIIPDTGSFVLYLDADKGGDNAWYLTKAEEYKL